MDRLKEVEAQLRTYIKSAKGILDKAREENRGLSEEEEIQVKGYVSASETLKRERTALIEGKSDADRIREQIEQGSRKDGWKAVAEAFSKGEVRVQAHLADLLGKTVTSSGATPYAGIETRPGAAPYLEDLRHFADAIPQQNLAPGTLHVEHFEFGARSIASGTIQRSDPLSTAAKAEVAQTITREVLDVQQYAVKMSNIPSQLFKSVPSLEAALKSSLGNALDNALDLAIFQAIDDHAEVLTVSGGTDFQSKLRQAKTDLIKNGANPTVAFVSDADVQAMDLLSSMSTSLAREYPFNLRLVGHPQLQAGEFAVLDPSGTILHLAGAEYLRDPYSGMDTNVERVRLEYNALFEIVEPRKLVVSGGSLVT